jgi:1-acyl-sn-glycerol-3-phosphate acyltransferase
MKQAFKLILCGLSFGGFIGSAFLAVLVMSWASPVHQKKCGIALTQFWARILLRIIGIQAISSRFAQRLFDVQTRGCLIVCNHQSYLDILALAAFFPVQFVAKREVRDWPVIGLIAKLAGTIFIDRSSTRQSMCCTLEIAQSLRQGLNVMVFPEGTSSNGLQVLPFKPMLMLAALKTQLPVLPLTLNYVSINQQPMTEKSLKLCCWYGEMEFIKHFWNVLAVRQIEVSLELHSMLNPPHPATSQELARLAHEKVASRFIAPPTTASTTSESLSNSNEFVFEGALMSLVSDENNYLQGVKYGET